ncbi:hypothetical protein TSOC_002953 [Tetrabaena socialis]|uniref:Uncharacterized protein n=1 Tax=Tetrabaena socialis TaxID=47790 RepID=A0A2J8ACR3_9CHLO|nr:hypothetical protein TSOC_002953 [Tetrabaena socialis]|eukprot:PNH10314.1 hypothetical protein TSOC_002953 [Tetrabaena socialis]
MPTIYCIGGVSGSGKSHLRASDNVLAHLPYLDILDVYDSYPGVGKDAALKELISQLEEHLNTGGGDGSSILEAFFAPGKLQRGRLDQATGAHGQAVSVPRVRCHRTQAINGVIKSVTASSRLSQVPSACRDTGRATRMRGLPRSGSCGTQAQMFATMFTSPSARAHYLLEALMAYKAPVARRLLPGGLRVRAGGNGV